MKATIPRIDKDEYQFTEEELDYYRSISVSRISHIDYQQYTDDECDFSEDEKEFHKVNNIISTNEETTGFVDEYHFTEEELEYYENLSVRLTIQHVLNKMMNKISK